jgi:hypothetical protein
MDDQDHQDSPGGETQVQLSARRGSHDHRREALKRMGLFAAFTAPLMLGMLKAEKAMAAS